ncbi:MAG: pentapeptide repeat-containing protein, partial [Hyphomicrobiaceae bacterium]
MSEAMRIGPETETPVNPYSLLEAVNNSSDTAHTAWLIFLGLMTYLTIAVAGVTHRDLLLETPVTLPLLQVSIQQSQFFQFAPILLVMFHLGVVSQLVLLARKTLEFDQSVRGLEATDLRTHPLRLELHNFFFVQAIAGPHRSYVMSAFLHGMSWLTLVVLPVILLLYIQIRYLPFHDETVTWAHRIALVADIGMLVLIGIFLTRAETSFPAAFWRSTREHPFTFAGTSLLLAVVTFFSFFVATIPGEMLDRLAATMSPAGGRQGTTPSLTRGTGQDATPAAMGFSLPFTAARADGSLFGVFHRNLLATDLDLAAAKDGKGAESGLVLRGRDLRYAKLDRTDFRGADLTNVDLAGASLVGANMVGVRLQCADINELYLADNREAARCASAQGANFTRANMKGARLAGIDARGARFEEAILEAADLSYGVLTGANFSSAHLERADFSGGAQLQGANFLIATMQGADLSGASLPMADFSSAQMQGAVLSHAELQGAQLRDTDLEGADLGNAKLQGADLTRAKLTAADLRGARIWMTLPAADDALALADLSHVVLNPL